MGLNMIDFFSRMNKPGSTLSAGIAAAGEALPGITARRKEAAAEELAATSALAGLTQAERAEMLGISKEAMALRKEEMDRKAKLEAARIGTTPRDSDIKDSTKLYYAQMILPVEQGGMGMPPGAATMAAARDKAYYSAGLTGPKLAGTQEDKITKAWKEIDDAYFIRELQATTEAEKAKVAKDKQAEKDAAAARLRPESTAPVPPKKDGKVSLGPNKDADGKSVLPQTLPESTVGPNGKTLYLHPDGKYRAYIPAGK